MKEFTVYTDGGCSGNPGPGGWAFVVLENNIKIASSSGGNEQTTNNIMELNAVINAIKCTKQLGSEKTTIYTDSQYVQKGITEWIDGWIKKSWKNSAGKPVKNKELWQELKTLNSENNIIWCWVKGHAGIEFNELCDSMVQNEIQKFTKV